MNRLSALAATLLLLAGLAGAPPAAHAAASYANCNSFIDSLPTTTAASGTVCLRSNLTTTGESGGDAIILNRDHAVLDCNGHSIEYGGKSDARNGIYSSGKHNITVRNCVVRGFRFGIVVEQSQLAIGGHVVEDNVVEHGSYVGIRVEGHGSMVRRNRVADIGGLEASGDYYGIQTGGSVDVLDNTVRDLVTENNRVWGITTGASDGGTIRGNRIRGLSGHYAWGAIGISVDYSGRVTVSDNDISGTMVEGMYPSVGVLCFNRQDGSSNVRVSENVISGYPTMQQDCVDVGTNDYSL